jgi:hypothetical protein
MSQLIIALFRLSKAIYRSASDPEFRGLLLLTLVLLLSGTLFYANVEHWSYLDALYFCVMTMSTIGYGDFTPTTDFSKIFTIIYSLISIGVFVGVVSKLAEVMIKGKHRGEQGPSNDPTS